MKTVNVLFTEAFQNVPILQIVSLDKFSIFLSRFDSYIKMLSDSCWVERKRKK